MIDPACIKEPVIPLICFHLPSMLPLNSTITLTTSSDSQKLLLLPSDDTNHCNAMKKDEPYRGKVKRGY